LKSHLIAITGAAEAGKSSVWVMDPDGTNPHEQVSAGLSDRVFYPSWYPNGEQLADVDGRDLVIKRIDLGRDSVATLTDHKRILTGMPSVSPDGKWIAFAGQQNSGQPYDQLKNNIWLLDLGSGAVRSLEAKPEGGRAPSWSPDGTRLAFESDRGSLLRRYAVFVVDRDGGRLQQVTDYDLNGNHPVWSPDGRRLAFAARDGWLSKGTRIAIVDVPARP
jgi:TolB protein